MVRRVCIVTEEWPGIQGCGGIGTAFYEQATLLAQNRWKVDVLLVPIDGRSTAAASSIRGVDLYELDLDAYAYGPQSYEKRSYAVAMWLKERDALYTSIQFGDYKGLGFFSTSLKRQGLAFSQTELTVQLHGYTRWAMELNGAFFSHEDQLTIDYLERESTRQADAIVAPSRYMIDWAQHHGFLGSAQRIQFIPNCHTTLQGRSHQAAEDRKPSSRAPVTELVFVGRHEERKALDVFVEAVLSIEKELIAGGIQITIVGGFGKVNGTPSGLYLMNKFGPSGLRLTLHTDFNRHQVIDYLCDRPAPLVVIPSLEENSPYAVLEPLVIGIPVLTSNRGGARELMAKASVKAATFEPTAAGLAEKLLDIVQRGAQVAAVSDAVRTAHADWLAFLDAIVRPDEKPKATSKKPALITVGITHYERPDKLLDAVTSILLQDYPSIELLVVDDGSKKPQTLAKLDHVERVLARVGGRLIRQPNAYLGAARNRLIAEAKGDFIVFLDDDNVALPQLVSTLHQAMASSAADIVTAQSIFMPVDKRVALIAARGEGEPVSYVPPGGPISLAPIRNVFGDATGIYSLAYLKKLGGYTELRNVGHEDFELLARAVFDGGQVVHCPVPTYLYEIGRPSMLTNNSMERDFQRVYRVVLEYFNRRSTDFSDFCQVAVGKYVAENSHNREYWKLSLSEDKDLLLPLLNRDTPRDQYIGNLIKLSVLRGHPNFAGALYSLLDAPPPMDPMDRPARRSAAPHSASSRQRGMALFGLDGQAFVDELVRQASETFILPDEAIALVNNWALLNLKAGRGGEFITPEFCQLLVEQLEVADPSAAAALSAILINLLVLLCLCDNKALLAALLWRLFVREAAAYVAQYEDMKKMFAAQPEGSYVHFAKHGKSEGRKAFAAVEAFLKLLAGAKAPVAVKLVVRDVLLGKRPESAGLLKTQTA